MSTVPSHRCPRLETDPRLFSFVGGASGAWSVVTNDAVVGPALDHVTRLDVVPGRAATDEVGGWVLRGVTSNVRYATRTEQASLAAVQAAPGRPEATRAALIPIRKSDAWWALPQDERRTIVEETSHHIALGLRYLPAIARRLHHCRDLSEPEPFDFLTWFDYAPADAHAFEELVSALRATEEWTYVEHEVDIRLAR